MTERRKPKQERSLKRYNHILDTSAQLFVEIGVEAVTTNLIAERAEVSIGSVYQYFPNKEAILEGLVERYVEDYRAFNIQKFGLMNIDSLTTTDLIHLTVESIMAFESEHVGFDTVFAQSTSLSEQLRNATLELHTEVIQQVSDMIQTRYPQIISKHVQVYAAVIVSMVKNIKPLTSAPNNLPPEPVLTETKYAILAYIRDLLIREDIPIPDDLA